MRRGTEVALVARTALVAVLVGLLGTGTSIGSSTARMTSSARTDWTGTTRAACSPTNPFPATLSAPATMPSVWWTFGIATGATNVPDQSGHGASGTVRRAGLTFGPANPGLIPCDSTYAMGQPGTATSQGFVSTTTPRTSPTSYSIATWIRTTSLTGGRILGFGNSMTGGSSVHDRALLLDRSGRPVLHVRTSTGNLLLTGPSTVADGGLHWLTATFDGSVAKLYVDGARAATASPVAPRAAYAGYWRAGWDQNIAALIPAARNQAAVVQDEIAIWDGRVLSAGEITALWRSSHW